MNADAEIIAIGNELLRGDVLDTNSHWLAGQLAGLGAAVRRVTVLPDEVATIAAALRLALGRSPALLITSGGLGPTGDDLTLEAVADSLGQSLQEHPQALEWVTACYARLAARGLVATAEMTPPRRKMALLPAGAEPLANGVGAAPGVLLKSGATALVCLPGVPEELRDIFQGALRPTLAATLGANVYVQQQLWADCGDESVLAPWLGQVAAAHPEVQAKSRARRFGAGLRFLITLSARGSDERLVQRRLAAAADDLSASLSSVGIAVSAVEERR